MHSNCIYNCFINTTNDDEFNVNTLRPQFSDYTIYFAPVALIVSLFGIFGNGLIIIATVSKSSQLKSKSHYLIAHLAFADFICCLFHIEVKTN
jgi:hypothetical protein